MYKKKQESADSLSVDDLYNHFSTMFGETDTENPQNESSENDFPASNIVDEFDADFTEAEIHEAIFSQKENKSPGIDNLPSEILYVWRGFLFLWVLGMGYVILLWHSLSLPYNYFVRLYCAPFLLTVYNRLLNTGEYPRAWG